ncbi:O-methyltransferase involved in polyketide biosynthesis [Aequitasia blattaphilus]|uniref:Class I SAM-dependent methyltransferase n=1 Tax=Aequitasia blattaphilus TaxID=2949332 RepID=A0ABT1E7F5_9FIRM|nr:class I SAM-dependent methyltransferase [Aequitasia blattaphilus]MCP1101718.1 class I SAM-dependent methyltransferase [Aequitasia blattaphilus]MCR8614358.1 class I SAM-dependent methyltransferase [Aequitasia blattaphilus]
MRKLHGVADTLFIPLEARIFVSKNYPEYFYDAKALELEKYIPDNSIRKNSSEYSMMASVARYYNMDQIVKTFIDKHELCNIVYLGAGLETAYYRLNTSKALFYEVDLPDVIAARHSVLGETKNDFLIGGDLFSLQWTAQIDTSLPTLIVVSGVFQYFTEEKILKCISDLKSTFKFGQLLFDATNETGIKYANKYVQKTGNKNALMYFFINNSLVFAKRTNTSLIEEHAFFKDARKLLSKKLGLYTRIAMKIVDDKKRAILVHLKLIKK